MHIFKRKIVFEFFAGKVLFTVPFLLVLFSFHFSRSIAQNNTNSEVCLVKYSSPYDYDPFLTNSTNGTFGSIVIQSKAGHGKTYNNKYFSITCFQSCDRILSFFTFQPVHLPINDWGNERRHLSLRVLLI